MLNSSLWRAVKEFQPDARAHHENEPGQYSRTITEKEVGGRTRRYLNYVRVSGGDKGESYQLNCPFCQDTRKRLHISYLFGRFDSEFMRRNWGNAVCYNEECLRDRENARSLMEMLGIDPDGVSVSTAQVHFDESQTLDLSRAAELTWPGKSMPLADLPPEHPARQYVSGRGLNVEYISKHYGVHYLERAHSFQALDDRLLVPFYRRGMVVGWSARVVGEVADDPDAPPKWLHSPGGMSGVLYGLRGAMESPVAVCVEGPIDKWAVGVAAFAVLGKTLGYEKMERLKQSLMFSDRVELVVVLLDPKQDDKSAAKGFEHHSLRVTKAISASGLKPTVDVRLPAHMDPGCSAADFLAKYLYKAVRAAGYENLAELLAGSITRTSANQ